MTKINKTQAKKLHENGKPYYMMPCKLNPANMFVSPSHIDPTQCNDFETLYNTFAYYNCNHYTGYYPAFYID